MPMAQVILKPGREKSARNRHPWIFSGAIGQEPLDLQPGDLVDVTDADGHFLGRGAYNPRSQIRVRIFTFIDEELDLAWFANRLAAAEAWRRRLLPAQTTAFRVCNGEGDGIPGLILDRYGDGLVATFSTAGADALREVILGAMLETLQPAWIMERSSGGFRHEEGLADRVGALHGEVPDDPAPILENGLKFLVDVRAGQKTGFFLDQRDNREGVRRVAEGRTVLNAFGYTGGFAVYALAGGARRAVTVDASREALNLAARNHQANGQKIGPEDLVADDVFQFLREDQTEFDMIVLDPPAFAKSKAAINRAARGYKDINLLAMRRLPPGGLLWTFSCSGHISRELHQKIIFAAAIDAGRDVQILRVLGHGFDHPINVYHPEGEYLSGFFCHISA